MANLKSLFLGLLFSSIGYIEVYSGSLSFCDGPEFMSKTRDQCTAGISFGENKPECVCVSGIYRFVADTCETAEGFAEEVCTKITDDSGLGSNIIGVTFTKDPVNWNQAGVVCERKGFGTETWDFIDEKHSRGATTKSQSIYGLNGKAFMTKGHYNKQAFCLEPAKMADDEKICRYLRSENEDIWKDSDTEVVIKAKCDGIPIVPHKCFGVLAQKDSECQLQCSRTKPSGDGIQGRSMGIVPQGRAAGVGRRGPKTTLTPPPPPTDPDNYTHPTEYWKHDNKFLNRKMIIYNIISQLETDTGNSSKNSTDNTTSKAWGEPKRTFEIYDMMKEITQSYCPAEYVAHDWIDLVIQLFYILHKGNIFRYDENLSPFEHSWIKEILTKCQKRLLDPTTRPASTVRLTSEAGPNATNTPDAICFANGGGKATGYCNSTSEEEECNFKPITVEPNRANDSFHYVPDAAWDIVDLIQVVCFPEFNESYRMFHVLEQAAEKLFTLQIKNLWYYPNWSDKTKKRLLGTSADTQMHNLEVCIYSAYDINGKIPRLVRPAPVKYLRKKRSAKTTQVSQGQYVDVFCSKGRKDLMNTACPKIG